MNSKNPDTSAILERFGVLMAHYRKPIVRIYVYAIFSGLVYLALPLGIQAVITFLQTGTVTYSWVVLSLLILLAIVFSGILTIYQMRVSENMEQDVFTVKAFDFYHILDNLKRNSINGVDLKEKMNRFFDVIIFQKKISKLLLEIPSASVQIVFGISLLCFYHPVFLLVILLLIGLTYLVYKISWKRGLKSSLQESDWKYSVADLLEKKALAVESESQAGPLIAELDEMAFNYLIKREQHFKTLMFQYSWMIGMKTTIVAVLLLMGGWLVISNSLNIGQFVAAEVIIILMLNSVEKLIVNMESIYDVLTSNEKINAVYQLGEIEAQ